MSERDCKHGQQARACNVCELERELAEAKADNALNAQHAKALMAEITEAKRERDEAQSNFAEAYDLALRASRCVQAEMNLEMRNQWMNELNELAEAASKATA